MANIPTPSGYVRRAVPKSQAEALSNKAHARAKTIAKSALEQYIRSFMDTDGPNRSVVNTLGSGILNFITDKSIQDDKDPRKKVTQLTRLYNEIRERTPAILIVDSSFRWLPNSLGSLDSARLVRDDEGAAWWVGNYHITAQVGVTVSVVTNDQDTTDTLNTFLCLIFQQVRNIAGGSRLYSRERGDQWEVRLPLTFDTAPTTQQPITEDRKDTLWTSTLELSLDYEDNFALAQRFIEWDPDDAGTGGRVGALDVPPVITIADTIQINTTTPFTVDKLRPTHSIVIDRPDIVTVDTQYCILTPRKLGTFRIQIVDRNLAQGPGTANASSVVAEKSVTVVL